MADYRQALDEQEQQEFLEWWEQVHGKRNLNKESENGNQESKQTSGDVSSQGNQPNPVRPAYEQGGRKPSAGVLDNDAF